MPTSPSDLAAVTRRQLRTHADQLHHDLRLLRASVEDVRRMLLEEARWIRQEKKARPRKVSSPPKAPVTVFHGKGGPISVPGHECTEPPPSTDSPRARD